MTRILFLCGMPGSGKTTLGKKLAAKLGWRFSDLDREITSRTGRSPAEWLREAGEPSFRKQEAGTLRQLDRSADTVVACGGGTPCFENNLEWMQQHGTCLFIDLPLKSIVQRLEQGNGIAQRPLLEGETTPEHRIQALWQQREPFYRRIEWWIDGLQADPEKLAGEIREKMDT